MKSKDFKISKESVDKVFTRYELTNVEDLSQYKSITDLICEAQKQAIKESIRANTVMISKRLAKVNKFTQFFGGSYADFPPLICGLEAYVTDELPEEFAFGLVEAPMTQREHYFEDGRKTGYKEGYKECASEIFGEIEEIIDKYYNKHIFGANDLEDEEKEAVINFSDDVTYDIAELKKKYTESEKDNG